MPDNLDQPDPAVPDYVPAEWLDRFGTKPGLEEDVRPHVLVLLVGVGVLVLTVVSVRWPSPGGWLRVAELGFLAVLAAGCWLAERLLTRHDTSAYADTDNP